MRDVIRSLIVVLTIGVIIAIWVYFTPLYQVDTNDILRLIFSVNASGYKAIVMRQTVQSILALVIGGLLFWIFTPKQK